jgi:hypothetical protein
MLLTGGGISILFGFLLLTNTAAEVLVMLLLIRQYTFMCGIMIRRLASRLGRLQ